MSEIIHAHLRMLRLLAAASIQGRCLFHSRTSDCVATIQGRHVFKEIQYALYANQTLYTN